MIKGHNGKLQPMEMAKLIALYGIYATCAEIIMDRLKFDPYFGVFLLLLLIASNNSKIDLGNILGKMTGKFLPGEKLPEIGQKENKEEKNQDAAY